MAQKLTQATYPEYLISIIGACFIAFGLGVILAPYFGVFAYFLVILGIIAHSWAMTAIHHRNS